MSQIKQQVDTLQSMYNNKNIVDKTSKARLTRNEFEDVSYMIKTVKEDGEFEISDDIKMELQNGVVTLLDA